MSPIDYKSSKLNKTEARKLVTRIVNQVPVGIRISSHAEVQFVARNVSIDDALNVLKSSSARILKEGELEKGTYRYQVETKRMVIVVAFESEERLVIVSGWRKNQ
jgi:hypothetical protein